MLDIIIALIILLFLSAFFSGIETAMMSVNMIRINSLVRKKKRGAEALHRVKQDPHKLIITILIGNNLMNIGAASLATMLFIDLFGSKGAGIATGVMTFLVLVFGEITPKTIAVQNAEVISLLVARPIEILSYVLLPAIFVFEFITRGVTGAAGVRKQKLSEEELKTIVTMGYKEGVLDREAAEIIHNVLDFEGTKASDIMTPKINIHIIDGDKKLKDVINFVVKSPYSRYPVYLKSQDNITGILDVDDVLKYAKNQNLNIKVRTIARKTFFVPESKEIDKLLAEFEGRKLPLAVVVDEYGDVVGLVTVEDILEEIVGDIFDKSRRKKSLYIKKVNRKLARVDARASVEELNKVLHLGIPEGHFDTIAGFIMNKLQRVPKKGGKVELKNVIIEVENATKQGIKSVKIMKK